MIHRLFLRAGIVVTLLFTLVNLATAQELQQWLSKQKLGTSAHTTHQDSLEKYYAAELFTIEGKGFDDTSTTWTRLPTRFKGKVTDAVWHHSQSSAGIGVRFVTNSPTIHAHWDAPRSFMNHMAASGSNGLDLYVRRGDTWKFAGTGVPKTTTTRALQIWPRWTRNNPAPADAAGTTTTAPQEFLLFLPSYSTTQNLAIGIARDAAIAPAPDRYQDKKPIVFYGTSISQGGCAPRSGLGHVERLRRWLDHPTVNLGFSGSGKCEPAMADVLSQIPAALYIVETVPNMSSELIKERTVPFIQMLRAAAPKTPILMVASPNVPLNTEKNAEWKQEFNKAVAAGVNDLHYLDGDALYGGTDNPTTDGVHPSDLGFYQMARHYEPKLREILGLPARKQ